MIDKKVGDKPIRFELSIGMQLPLCDLESDIELKQIQVSYFI